MIDKKKFMKDFEYMKAKAEATAYSKISLKRPLTHEEFIKFKECMKVVME